MANEDDDLDQRTPAYMDGLSDGFGDRTYNPKHADRKLYDAGFEAGKKKRAANVQQQETQIVSTSVFDPPILFDPVKIPQHYNTGKIEVTNFISDQGLNFARGNVVKYVCRAGKKDPAKELEDLEKAAAYLQMAYNLAQGKPAVVRDPETNEVVWTLFQNEPKPKELAKEALDAFTEYKGSEGPYYPN